MSYRSERRPSPATPAQPVAQHKGPAAAYTQLSATTSALQRHQQLADHSPQTMQLKRRTETMAAGTSGASVRAAQLQRQSPVQRAPDEELLQGKFAPAQRAEQPNQTGLPAQLKSGIESLSGMSMDHVKVHYNSDKPAQLRAHAYAQGSEIHVGPGQERHLPHEAWHVVQQAQGRVKPTLQMKSGVPVNNDAGLEGEADLMGERALQSGDHGASRRSGAVQLYQLKTALPGGVVQCNLNAYAMAGSSSGAFNNFFGTSTFEDIRTKLQQYKVATVDAEKTDLLKALQTLGKKWLSDNQAKTDANVETKRGSIRGLLSLVKQELSTRDNSAQYFKEAKAFEHRLGLYLFNFPAATTAAGDALDTMSQVMGVQADNSKAADVFGGADAKYAGNVGKDVTRVMGVINAGNLRERMTAFYNASLGPFKSMIQDHIRLSGPMAGRTWDEAKLSLTAKGMHANGVSEIEGRKNEIADYPNKFGYSIAKKLDKKNELLDVYKAPADRFLRSSDDALLRGQKIPFIKSEGRDDAFNLGAYSSDAFNFNFDAFDFTSAQLLGNASGSVRKTFAGVKEQLDTFLTTTSTNDKLLSYNKMWSLSTTWIKDNADKTDANSATKRQSLNDLQNSLRKVYSGSTRTPADLQSGPLNADLSNREKEFIMSQSPAHNTPDLSAAGVAERLLGNDPQVYDDTKPLPWEEGGSRFNANLRNAWVQEAVEKLKMPVVAGPSGTTDRMLQALKYLGIWDNPVCPEEFRLSLLGWMLTSNDHSFHEIMAVSKSFGLSYQENAYAYHHIPPLTIEQIRGNVCANQNFPDEIVYERLWPDFELVDNEIVVGGADPITAHGTISPGLQSRLSPIAAASIRLYTGGAYLVQNPAKEGGVMSNAKIKANVNTNKDGQLGGLKARMDAGQVNVDQLQAEAALHNPILDNALMDLPDYVGTTYRGQADFLRASYSIGDTHTFHKFTSSSKLRSEAIPFMETGTFKAPVLVVLNVTSGKDISTLSFYDFEQEVLLRPGSTFSVSNVEPNINDNSDGVPSDKRPYTRITMQEV